MGAHRRMVRAHFSTPDSEGKIMNYQQHRRLNNCLGKLWIFTLLVLVPVALAALTFHELWR